MFWPAANPPFVKFLSSPSSIAYIVSHTSQLICLVHTNEELTSRLLIDIIDSKQMHLSCKLLSLVCVSVYHLNFESPTVAILVS